MKNSKGKEEFEEAGIRAQFLGYCGIAGQCIITREELPIQGCPCRPIQGGKIPVFR